MSTKDFDSREDQLNLRLMPLRAKPIELTPLEYIAGIQSHRNAYGKTCQASALEQDEIAGYPDMDFGQFNRVLKGTGRHLNDGNETLLEQACGFGISTLFLTQ